MEVGFQPGAVLLDKYRVESVLGRGGMGIVLRVTHLHLGEELAIKILSPEAAGDPAVRVRFLREAQSAVRLRGEHVTRVSDVGMLPEGVPYIAMEYLRGVDLEGELGRREMLSPGDTVDYVLQACEALAEAHTLGIVHRDIKPSNLFLTYRPDGTRLVKVLDFGISKAPVAGPGLLTRTDTVMGTPGYMSPEQMKASKDVDSRSDIWALGIVLYECLSGRRPFDAESFSAVVFKVATEPPPPMDPRIPRGLQAVVLRCLEKDRAARFPSIAELTVALAPFARDARAASIIVERTAVMLRGPSGAVAPDTRFGQPPTATTLSGSSGMVRPRTRHRRYAVGGVGLLLATIVVISMVRPGGPSHLGGSEAESAVRDAGSASDIIGAQDRVDAAAGSSQTATVQAPAAASIVAVSPMPEDAMEVIVEHPTGTPDSDKGRQKVAHCQELEVQKDWEKLRDCARELVVLGAKDKGIRDQAEEFRVKAVKETSKEVASGKVQSAIKEGNLQEAQKQLKTIGSDSVYFTTTSEAFRVAEARAVEDDRRKALEMANAHDCGGLNHFQAQVIGSSTPAVAAAVAAVKCVERVVPVELPDPGHLTHCQELEAQKEWEKLRDCAGELAVLGAKDKGTRDQAEAFRVKAVRETNNEVAAGKVQSAINEGNLREAQKQLQTIGSDSVYFTTTSEAFRVAEARAVEDDRRKAQELANAHDCGGLNHFQTQVIGSSTPALGAAVAAVKCVERVASVKPPDPGPVMRPAGSGINTSLGATQPTPSKNSSPCDATLVEDIIWQSQNQYTAGFAQTALQLMMKALACKQDTKSYPMVKMYVLAAMYACAAHDAVSATNYFGKLPVQYKSAVAQRCQQEGTLYK